MLKRKDWIFVQEYCSRLNIGPIETKIRQMHRLATVVTRLKSVGLLFWDRIKNKVHENCFNQDFKDAKALKRSIRKVQPEKASASLMIKEGFQRICFQVTMMIIYQDVFLVEQLNDIMRYIAW